MSERVAIRWTDKDSKGCKDIFPVSLFSKIGVTPLLDHTVITPYKTIERARCEMTVGPLDVSFDYRKHEGQNKKWGMYLGVLRLTFESNSRDAIADMEWRSHYHEPFKKAEAVVIADPLAGKGNYLKGKKTSKAALKSVQERPGQIKFRNELLLAYGAQCCLTGCRVARALEGAHIDKFYGDQSDHVQNGLLLRQDLHALLDANMLGIHPKTLKAHFSVVARAWPEYANLDGVAKVVPPMNGGKSCLPSVAALERKWKAFKAAQD